MITVLEILVVILSLILIGVVVAQKARLKAWAPASAEVRKTCLAAEPAVWTHCCLK